MNRDYIDIEINRQAFIRLVHQGTSQSQQLGPNRSIGPVHQIEFAGEGSGAGVLLAGEIIRIVAAASMLVRDVHILFVLNCIALKVGKIISGLQSITTDQKNLYVIAIIIVFEASRNFESISLQLIV
jgi:hypothetical protein